MQILYIYLVIVGLVSFLTGSYYVLTEWERPIKGIDNMWDWITYSLIWPLTLLKSLCKSIIKLFI